MKKDQKKVSPSIRLGLVGWYPPPMGGISVHIDRFTHELVNIGINHVVYDISPIEKKKVGIETVRNFRKWVFYQIFSSSFDRNIIHNHLISWKQRALSLLFKFRKAKVIFTIHSLRDEINNSDLLNRFCKWLVLNCGDHFIAVAPNIKDKLVGLGVNPHRITVIPAFIPPPNIVDEKSYIPKHVLEFIENHQPLIVSNASRIGFFQGIDLYGIDLCLLLTARIKSVNPNVGMIFCLSKKENEDYFEKLMNQLDSLGLSRHFLFVTDPIEFYPILAKADLFVRPTNTDGDSISIREAQFLQIPVVCSDLPDRPNGVVLFKNRNLDDFENKTKKALSDPSVKKKSILGNQKNNGVNISYIQNILKIYQEILHYK